jgi:hypothetical protein
VPAPEGVETLVEELPLRRLELDEMRELPGRQPVEAVVGELERAASAGGGERAQDHEPAQRLQASSLVKSGFSRTAQSGQAQSAGTDSQRVPGGKPSRGLPRRSS